MVSRLGARITGITKLTLFPEAMIMEVLGSKLLAGLRARDLPTPISVD